MSPTPRATEPAAPVIAPIGSKARCTATAVPCSAPAGDTAVAGTSPISGIAASSTGSKAVGAAPTSAPSVKPTWAGPASSPSGTSGAPELSTPSPATGGGGEPAGAPAASRSGGAGAVSSASSGPAGARASSGGAVPPASDRPWGAATGTTAGDRDAAARAAPTCRRTARLPAARCRATTMAGVTWDALVRGAEAAPTPRPSRDRHARPRDESGALRLARSRRRPVNHGSVLGPPVQSSRSSAHRLLPPERTFGQGAVPVRAAPDREREGWGDDSSGTRPWSGCGAAASDG